MTTINAKQIAVDQMASLASGNLLRYNTDGLYMALEAAANVAQQYVSSSTGNDANDGSRAAPLKTIAFALSRLPANATGTIYLLETDTFPVRALNDPTTWGTTISYFGSVLTTGFSNVTIAPYGPQTDNYNALAVGSIGFAGWQVNAAPRPILEFGHYMYNGKPVGCIVSLGSSAGQRGSILGCEIRVTPECRAAVNATNTLWTGLGNQSMILAVTSSLLGCKFPSPITTPGGAKNWILSLYENVDLWQCYIPVESTPWIVCGGTTNLNISDTGATTYDRNGTGYPTLTNTVATNLASRIEGVVKDTNGVTRNIFSNVNI